VAENSTKGSLVYSGYEREPGQVQDRKRAAVANAAQLAFNLDPAPAVPENRQQIAANFNTLFVHTPTAAGGSLRKRKKALRIRNANCFVAFKRCSWDPSGRYF
jgi:hypothetical protein